MYSPVCGVNGQDFDNEDIAQKCNVEIASFGRCPIKRTAPKPSSEVNISLLFLVDLLNFCLVLRCYKTKLSN